MKILKFFLAVMISMTIFSPQSMGDEVRRQGGATPEPIAGVGSFNLSDEEKKKSLSRAAKGDSEAAMRLAVYYDFVKLDAPKAIFWLRKAAAKGNVTAQYNLGIKLIASRNSGVHAEGVKWLEKAAAAGEPLAKSALEEIAVAAQPKSQGTKNK